MKTRMFMFVGIALLLLTPVFGLPKTLAENKNKSEEIEAPNLSIRNNATSQLLKELKSRRSRIDTQLQSFKTSQFSAKAGKIIEVQLNTILNDCDPEFAWKNHGQYVSCVAKNSDDKEDVKVAARSDIGKKFEDEDNEDESNDEDSDEEENEDEDEDITPTPTPTVSVTTTPTPIPTATPTGSVTSTPTPTTEPENEIVAISTNNLAKFFAMLEELFNSLIK